MCDEYDDERMIAFWRGLEQQEQRERLASEGEEAIELPVRVEPDSVSMSKGKPRVLTR